jgi:hypothetical protein
MSELPQLHIGDHVQDREDPDATMLVVGLPGTTAADYDVTDAKTVAGFNPRYPADDLVVEVVYPSRTDVSIDGAQQYAFPRSRLECVAAIHDVDDQEVPA